MLGLSSFQTHMLFVISGNEKPHGLAIKSTLSDVIDDDVNHGRLYPNLDELVEDGYLEKGDLDRRTNYYELTEYGEEQLDEYINWLQEQRKISIET